MIEEKKIRHIKWLYGDCGFVHAPGWLCYRNRLLTTTAEGGAGAGWNHRVYLLVRFLFGKPERG